MFSLLQEGYNMVPPMFTKAEVQQAVSMGWITQAQCDQIIGTSNPNQAPSQASVAPSQASSTNSLA